MRLDVVGPAAFRAAFAPTNLGALAASEEGEALWRPLLAPAERIWQQWNGDDEFEATRQRVLDYTGRIRVLWMVQPDAERGTDRVFGVLALETDGATDLSALAGDLSRTIQAILPDAPTPRAVGEHALQLVGDPEGESMTLPVVLGGSLVAFFGEAAALERTVPQCLEALAADTAPPTAPVSFQLDLAQLRELWALRESPAVAEFLGMRSLRSLRASLGPNGPHVQLQVDVEFDEPTEGAPQQAVDERRRGIMAGLLPSVGTLPGLLARVPAAATPWLALPFRADLLLRAGLQVAAAEDETEGGVEGVRQRMQEELGFYPDTELLDHMSGEVMILGDLWQSEDPDVFRRGDNPPLGACIAFSLRDAAAFRRGLDKLLHYLKGHVHLYETREVEGVAVTRLGTMFLTGMHMAVGQGLFAVGFGDEGVAQLEALVAGRPAAPDGTYPEPVQRVSYLAPAGWNGVGAASLSAMLGGQIVLVLEMLDDALPAAMRFGFSSDKTQDWLDRLRPLVEKHEVDHIVTMTGYHRGHWQLRVLW